MTLQAALPPSPDIMRRSNDGAKLVHCVYPAWRAHEFTSISDPCSIGVAFTWQPDTVVERQGGPAHRREIPPNSIGICGADPIAWLAVSRPSEQVEITLASLLRRSVADELRASAHADLDDQYGFHDPVVLAIAQRVRAGLRGWSHVSPLEYETLARAAYGQVLIRRFGAKRLRLRGGLDRHRLARVVAFIRDDPTGSQDIEKLAAIAAVSPFHFARAFRRATGLTPHRFVTMTRIEAAASSLRRGEASVAQAASAAGFTSLRHFRRLLRQHCGSTPSALLESKRARMGPNR